MSHQSLLSHSTSALSRETAKEETSMTDSPDQHSADGWREATGADRDAVVDEILQRREQALSATSGTAALGYELDEDGDILWWMSPAFLLQKGLWAPAAGAAHPTRRDDNSCACIVFVKRNPRKSFVKSFIVGL